MAAIETRIILEGSRSFIRSCVAAIYIFLGEGAAEALTNDYWRGYCAEVAIRTRESTHFGARRQAVQDWPEI